MNNEIEVYRISPQEGKYYYHAEYDRQEGRYPNSRYFVSPKNIKYVGLFIKEVRQGYGDGGSCTAYFSLNGQEVLVHYSYEGRTSFVEATQRVTNDINIKLNNLIEDKERFDFIKDDNNKEMIKNAYNAITKADCWNYMKKDVESYMFANDPEIWKITKAMADLGYSGHSGFSFGCVMKEMQYIAQNGYTNWKNENMSNQK